MEEEIRKFKIKEDICQKFCLLDENNQYTVIVEDFQKIIDNLEIRFGSELSDEILYLCEIDDFGLVHFENFLKKVEEEKPLINQKIELMIQEQNNPKEIDIPEQYSIEDLQYIQKQILKANSENIRLLLSKKPIPAQELEDKLKEMGIKITVEAEKLINTPYGITFTKLYRALSIFDLPTDYCAGLKTNQINRFNIYELTHPKKSLSKPDSNIFNDENYVPYSAPIPPCPTPPPTQMQSIISPFQPRTIQEDAINLENIKRDLYLAVRYYIASFSSSTELVQLFKSKKIQITPALYKLIGKQDSIGTVTFQEFAVEIDKIVQQYVVVPPPPQPPKPIATKREIELINYQKDLKIEELQSQLVRDHGDIIGWNKNEYIDESEPKKKIVNHMKSEDFVTWDTQKTNNNAVIKPEKRVFDKQKNKDSIDFLSWNDKVSPIKPKILTTQTVKNIPYAINYNSIPDPFTKSKWKPSIIPAKNRPATGEWLKPVPIATKSKAVKQETGLWMKPVPM